MMGRSVPDRGLGFSWSLMRFEVDKVLAHIETLNQLADQDPATIQRKVAADLAARFERAGLAVEQLDGASDRSPSPLADLPWILLACLATAQSLLTDQGHKVAWLYLSVAELLGMWLAPRVERWLARRQPEHVPVVVARRADETTGPLKLIVFSELVRAPRLWPWLIEALPRFLIFACIMINIVRNAQKIVNNIPGPVVAPLICMWLALAVQVVAPRLWQRAAGWREARHGVAILAELARTWPKSAREAMNTSFIAFGMNSMGEVAGRTLDRASGLHTGQEPVLLISLDGVGYGSKLVIFGQEPGFGLAMRAARDLWLPHRARLPGWFWRRSRRGFTAFCLMADEPPLWRRVLKRETVSPEVNPALLSATAQLITEVALRWARQHSETQGASASKSSQNPG